VSLLVGAGDSGVGGSIHLSAGGSGAQTGGWVVLTSGAGASAAARGPIILDGPVRMVGSHIVTDVTATAGTPVTLSSGYSVHVVRVPAGWVRGLRGWGWVGRVGVGGGGWGGWGVGRVGVRGEG
jgi:hypothetical protein